MTSQLRYRTLVDNLARIYDATDETRTGRLQEGLTKVLETIDPKSSDGWQHVKADSMRLLRVWRAREDCQGDSTLADQILEALTDFATDDVPHLEITERPVAAVTVTPPSETRAHVPIADTRAHIPIAAHVPLPVVIETPMTPAEIRAIEAALDAVEDEADEIEAALADDEEVETDEEEDEVEVDEEAVALPAPVPAAAVTETDTEEEVASDTEVEEEEEEVVEPEADSEAEADEEEEEGVEVEKRTIRGREYWLSSDGTLYAVADDDEIGEEVGRINKDGRPVFLAPK